MPKRKISRVFQDLGIFPEPLPEYYTPDLYAQKLMERYDRRKPSQLIFSSTVEYYKKE